MNKQVEWMFVGINMLWTLLQPFLTAQVEMTKKGPELNHA